MPAEHDDGRDAPEGRDPVVHVTPDGPPPADGPPVAFDFDDLRDQLRRFGLLDPITPAEAAEELDDLESDEDDPADHRPGSRRTWAELDACVEAERRCDLDFIEAASKIFLDHTRRVDGDEATGTEWKLVGAETLPPAPRREFVEFLTEVARSAAKVAAKLGGDQ